MKTSSKFYLVLLRLSLGGIFFYAGITKVLDPDWTAAGFLNNSSVLTDIYSWFALSSNIEWVNLLNQWGLTAIGVSLILGLLVRYSSFFGMLLMVLYYIPETANFPYIGDNSFIVDSHLVYIIGLGVVMTMCAGNYFGLDKFLPTCDNQIEDYGEDVERVNYQR